MEQYPEFRTFLDSMGYEIQEIDHTVDNLYKAISCGVYGTPNNHAQVRTEVGNYVARHQAEFAFVTLANGLRVCNPQVKHLLPLGTWEMKRSIAAASLLYGIVVVIITQDGLFHQYPDSGGFDRAMTLSFQYHNHFNVLTQLPKQAEIDSL